MTIKALFKYIDVLTRKIISFLFPDEKFSLLEKARRYTKKGMIDGASRTYKELLTKYPNFFGLIES